MSPDKCAFGVSVGEFLGFLVHEGRIEVGKKIMKATEEVVPPTNLKELQSLLGKINFVRRFISNLSQKVLRFSPLL
jgi:translation initiation factor IF-2